MGAGISPQLGAVLAKLLADVGTTFAADNPQQQALGGVLSDRIGGLVRAQAFNRSQQLTENIQGALRGPGVGPGLPGTQANLDAGGGAFVSPDLAPGITTAAGPVTQAAAGAPGVAPPAQVDPFQALALGQEGTQELIRTQQQQRFETQRGLERQKDFNDRLTLLRKTQENREEFFRLQFEAQQAQDIAQGGPETRAAGLRTAEAGAGRAERIEAGAPTPEQAQQLTAAQLATAQAGAQRAQTLAAAQPELSQAQIQRAQVDAGLSPSEISTIQRTAIRQVSPGMLRQLRKRLSEDDPALTEASELLRLLGSDELDETGRRSNFDALAALLDDDELEFFQGQILRAEGAITQGQLPSGAVPLGGTVPPPTGPVITDIDTLSIGDALSEEDVRRGRF